MRSSSSYSSILLMDSGNIPVNDINFFDELGNRKNIKDSVARILKKEGADFVVLEGGLEIPIERIHSVDGDISPHYTDEFFKCDCV